MVKPKGDAQLQSTVSGCGSAPLPSFAAQASNYKESVSAQASVSITDSDERKKIPHHMHRGTGVLVAISPAKPNYRGRELMYVLYSNKPGNIDYVPMSGDRNADGLDEDVPQSSRSRRKSKKGKTQVIMMEVGGMVAGEPAPKAPNQSHNVAPPSDPNPKLTGKLGQRNSGFAAGLDPTKLKPGAAPPKKCKHILLLLVLIQVMLVVM